MGPYRIILWLPLLFCCIQLHAQAPANDSCQNAYDIPVGGGYGIGKFISKKANLKDADKQAGESIDSLLINIGNDKKTVWYRFETKTRRSVGIQLRQKDSGIAQNAVGFVVYRTDKCLPNPGLVSTYLPAISKFGSSNNTCLQEGIYYIQVCANNTAKDSIWLELNLDVPSPNDYDNAKNAYDFGIVGTVSKSVTFHAGCQSIDSIGELNKDIGANYKDFNQSAWLTLTTPSYIDDLLNRIDIVNTHGELDTAFIAFQLFEGDAKTNVPGLKSIGNLKFYQGGCAIYNNIKYCDAFIPQYACDLKPNTRYSIKLLFRKDADFDLKLTEVAYGRPAQSYDRLNLPSAYKEGTLKSGAEEYISDIYSCNARIQANSCFSTSPGLYIDSFGYNGLSDTFDLNSWVTFKLPFKGSLQIGLNSSYCTYYILYKGDATKTCKLTQIVKGYSGYRDCLDSGTYSVQILYYSKRINNARGTCDNQIGGLNYTLYLLYDSSQHSIPGIHYKASLADDMGDITSLARTVGIKSSSDYCTSPGDSVVIAGTTYKSNFIFRQFYISSPLYLTVTDLTYGGSSYTIFQGKATDGLSALKPVSKIYSGLYWKNRIVIGNGCKPFRPGWYTILTCANSSFCNTYSPGPSTLFIKEQIPCNIQFDKPYKAALLNKGIPLDYGPDYGKPGLPDYQKLYLIPVECIICNDTPYINYPGICKIKYKPERISYFVFTLKRESNLQLVYLGSSNFLVKGDIRVDSSIINDTTAFLSGCEGANDFCRLGAGTYTLMNLNGGYDYVDFPPHIVIDTVGYASNDFATHAYDFGIIPSNKTIITSPFHQFYCTTSATNTDPDLTSNKYGFPNNNNSKNIFSVPPVMPLNYFSNQEPQRNLWYTFQLVGSGKATITVRQPNRKDPAGFNYLPFWLLKSNKAGTSFADLKAQGKVDSTIGQGLAFSYYYWSNNLPNPFTFTKSGCDTVRYYIVAEAGSLNCAHTIDIQFDGTPYNDSANYCYNAKQLSLTGAGKATASVPVNCHTMGESYGEDGSNMGCLISNKNMVYGTSWFLFHLTGPGKYDISFSITNNTDASSQDVRFRVLYGSCNAMTPALCVENAYAGFTMDCMGAGDYYIQVTTPQGAIGRVNLIATVIKSKFPFCKPFSLIKPLANFLANGGCNGQAMIFSNLSTAGTDIRYNWVFGDGTVSTLKSPVHTYKVSNPVTKFNVRLIVTNAANSLQDTLIAPVYVYRDPVKVDMGKDTTILCGQAVPLHARSNYADAIYHWSPSTGMSNPYDSNQLVNPNWDTWFTLSSNIENCTVTDSILIKVSKHVDIKGMDYLCNGSSTILHAPVGFKNYHWNYTSPGDTNYQYPDSILITKKAGIYYLQVTNDYCYASDTIRIYNLGKEIFPVITRFMCQGDTITITSALQDPGLHYKWSNGDTTAYTQVHDTGIYKVFISNYACGSYSTTHVVQKKYFIKLPKQDSVVCENILPYLLKVNTDAPNILWNTGDTTRSIKVNKAGWYSLIAGTGHCAIKDSMKIRIANAPPKPNLGIDTTICSNQSITLDAGFTGLAYKWNTGEQTKTIKTKDSGVYILTVTNGLCFEHAYRHIHFKDAYLHLGNDTFFCKGQQLVLKPKTNCTDFLWSTGEKRNAIYANNAGMYWVKGMKDVCTLYDTINVRLSYPPIVHLGKDTLICDSFDMVLDAGPGDSYQWYPGGETSRRIYIRKHGPYTVIVKNKDGCTGSDTLRILEDCDPTIFVPNAFHAMDGDPNEIFKAYGTYISYFDMKIYNRWGERLFETENINQGWDGRYKGELSEDGVYLYVIEYKGRYTHKQLTGTFHLLR